MKKFEYLDDFGVTDQKSDTIKNKKRTPLKSAKLLTENQRDAIELLKIIKDFKK
jgi:hypothetical protein